MSEELRASLDTLIKIVVPIIAGVVGWILKVLWDHHGEIGKLKSEAYTQKDAMVDRKEILGEFRSLRHEIKEDFQRIEKKIDDMREGE